MLENGVARVNDEGVIYSKRMVKDESLRNRRAEGGKAGSKYGVMGADHGSKGGRPKRERGVSETPLETPLETHLEAPSKPPPSSSSSTSVYSVPNGTVVNSVDPPLSTSDGSAKGELVAVDAGRPADMPNCPHEKLLDLWAEHCPSMVQPRRSLWGASEGAKALRARWRWVLTTVEDGQRLATNEAQALDWFAKFFAYVASCPMLRGENDRGWQAGLEWTMKPANFSKIMQGNYEPRVVNP